MNSVVLNFRKPFDLTMESAIQLIFAPKRKYLKDEYPVNKISFIAKFVFLVLISPFTLFCYGTALVLDVMQKNRNFTYLKGELNSEDREVQKVLSWNVCALFGGLPMAFGGVKKVKDRMGLIAEKIKEINADVISLSEVSPPAADLLFRKLKDTYAHFYTRIRKDPFLTLDSALFVASKVEIKDPKMIELPLGGLMRRAIFSFQVADTKFLTTHLHPGLDEKDKEVRLKQVNEIKSLSNGKTILFGDLNIRRGDEFKNVGLGGHFSDPTEGEPITATDRMNGDEVIESIDYFLLSKDLSGRVEIVQAFDENGGLSDHHALSLELR
jgi:endonuclease/exonuclease/phosphatase family metal-dependent hydrolase